MSGPKAEYKNGNMVATIWEADDENYDDTISLKKVYKQDGEWEEITLSNLFPRDIPKTISVLRQAYFLTSVEKSTPEGGVVKNEMEVDE